MTRTGYAIASTWNKRWRLSSRRAPTLTRASPSPANSSSHPQDTSTLPPQTRATCRAARARVEASLRRTPHLWQVPLVCTELPLAVCQALGAKPLSECVVEVPAGKMTPIASLTPIIRDTVRLWNLNLCSKSYRIMLRRVVARAPAHVRDEALRKIASLAYATVVPVADIRSRFLLTTDGEQVDVTKASLGSKALLVSSYEGERGPTLYVSFSAHDGTAATKLLKQSRVPIAKQLDHYIGTGAAKSPSIFFQLMDVDVRGTAWTPM